MDSALTQTYPATARSGSGTLAVIRFKSLAPGTSPVDVTLAQLLDDTRPDPQPIAATAQDGQVTVGAAGRVYLPVVLRF